VFRGGCTREAAGQVVTGAEASPHLLAALVRKSFLQHDPAEPRYQIHELLRQCGAEKLASDPTLEAAVRDQHSRFYCDLLGQQEVGIQEGALHEVMQAIQGDMENVRAACMWAATEGPLTRLEQAVNPLGWFYYQGYANYQQGESTFRRLGAALAAAETWPSSATAGAQRAMARVLAFQATFRSLLGDPQTGRHLLRKSRALFEGPGLADEDTRHERAYIAYQSGYNWLYTDPAKARQRFAKGLELYQEIGDKLGMAYALMALGRAAVRLDALDEAREAMTRSTSLHWDTGNQTGQSEAMATLGGLAARQWRFREAEDLIQQSLSLTPETNRFGIAYGLAHLGNVQLLTGRFAEAKATISECIAISEELGWRMWAVRRSYDLVHARLHAGEYDAARIQAEGVVSAAQEAGWGLNVRYGKLVLGEVALSEANFAQSCRILRESQAELKQFTDDPWDVNQSAWLGLEALGLERRPEAWLGLAARGLERTTEAWRHLVATLEWAGRNHQFMELMVALAGIALLLADKGEAERAVELYALASRHPFVANSHWFEDVIGQHIAAVAATLPPQVAATAQERGRSRDLEATAAQLLAELGSWCDRRI
jgi:tetratricopeptide (TPR) repeat protein